MRKQKRKGWERSVRTRRRNKGVRSYDFHCFFSGTLAGDPLATIVAFFSLVISFLFLSSFTFVERVVSNLFALFSSLDWLAITKNNKETRREEATLRRPRCSDNSRRNRSKVDDSSWNLSDTMLWKKKRRRERYFLNKKDRPLKSARDLIKTPFECYTLRSVKIVSLFRLESFLRKLKKNKKKSFQSNLKIACSRGEKTTWDRNTR